MKRILVLFAVALALFISCPAVLAEGFSIGGDYTITEPGNDPTKDVGVVSFVGTCDLDPFVVGGSLNLAISIDPPFTPPEEVVMEYLYGVYGGYKIVSGDAGGLAVLIGYYGFMQDYLSPAPLGPHYITEASSIAVGFKGDATLGPLSLAFTYFYGVSNGYTLEIGGTPAYESPDAGFSYLEVKGAYAFSEAWSAYAVYRDFSVVDIATDHGLSGFGVGVTYVF